MEQIFRRRAGVATPLFSIQSKKSVGVGEIPDLLLLGDWCLATGLSVIQLLPMNDMGFNFRPYDSESSIALEPMHLSLEKISDVTPSLFAKEIAALRKKYPLDSFWFDTSIKKDKLALLRQMYAKRKKSGENPFKAYCALNKGWLEDFVLFKVIKEKMGYAAWETWPKELKDRQEAALKKIRKDEKEELGFHRWTQWQLFLQFKQTSAALQKKGVLLMGDLPFLVSRDSADVWSRPEYFKLGYSAGAPPDLYLADGQEWGMPPYDWEALRRAGYDMVLEKLRYAENFYDLFRIDHFVGLFRVWTFPREGQDPERKKLGAFDPADESVWEEHGERIISVILSGTKMRPCAEDLGVVPDCSARVLARHGIPGMEIQRWARDWKNTRDFIAGDQYRENSIVCLSTHDMAPFETWWEGEATEEDRVKFWSYLKLPGEPKKQFTKALLASALKAASASRSVFSIQLLQDWLALGDVMGKSSGEKRINQPGIVSPMNWRLRMPLGIEEMKKFSFNEQLLSMHRASRRCE